MSEREVIAAIATAAGRGGIGIVRVSGPRLLDFARGLTPHTLPPRHAVWTPFLDADGAAIDEGLMLYFAAPRSYTGEDVLELQGHGGPVVMAALLQRCLQLGARLARPGEFTQRAYLNGRMDLAQAEGVADLIDASTATAARAALNSLQGLFSQFIQELNNDIVRLRTLLEATLDFPEEEVEFLTAGRAEQQLQSLRERLDATLAAARQGSLLRDGIQVVLVGAPNVGKSSLLNCLAGDEIAIVTAVPGTTRDALRQQIQIDGVPVHIIDTAGLRETDDLVEQVGIRKTRDMMVRADLALVIAEASAAAPVDSTVRDQLPTGLPCIRVMNKIDLVGLPARAEHSGPEVRIWLSARSGDGIDLLRRAIAGQAGVHPSGEGLFTARARHVEALRLAGGHLSAAAGQGARLELYAEELRLAHEALSRITGEFTPDDLLGEIFTHFCIGK